MSSIEQTPLTLENARNLTMHIRNLGAKFSLTTEIEILNTIVPRYLFGLLTAKFQPVQEAAVEAISKVSESNSNVVWDIAYQYLTETEIVDSSVQAEINQVLDISVYDCSNLQHIETATHDCIVKFSQVTETLRQFYLDLVRKESSSSIKSMAIKVLTSIPKTAERHSRLLVPFLLDSGTMDEEEEGEPQKNAQWTFKDRLNLLELFSLFVNPKTMFRSDDMRQHYLYLLGHRSEVVQRIALKCLLTFKDKQIAKYTELLEGLLDDSRFKDSLTISVRPSDQEGAIHSDDRDSVLPIIVRIMFGRAQTTKGSNSRFFAVISALSSIEPEFLVLFVTLATEQLNCRGFLVSDKGVMKIEPNHFADLPVPDLSVLRRLVGFLSVAEKLIEVIGSKATVVLNIILEAIIFSLYTCEKAQQQSQTIRHARHSIRNSGIKSLNLLLTVEDQFDFTSYFEVLYENILAPRLPTFVDDNSEQPSGLLRLFVTLTTKPKLANLLSLGDFAIARALFSCLEPSKIPDSVIDLIMDSINNVLEGASKELSDSGSVASSDAYFSQILEECVPKVLSQFPRLLTITSNGQLLEKEAAVLVRLAGEVYVEDDDHRSQLVEVLITALERPTNRGTVLSVRTKADLVGALASLLKDERTTTKQIEQSYSALSPLFKQLSDRASRQNLSTLFLVLGSKSPKYERTAGLISNLNAFSKKRLDSPDFDRRLEAFANINETLYNSLSAEEWMPLIYNMLYFVRDPEELSIRSNSSYSLRRYIDSLSESQSLDLATPFIKILENIILPAIRLGVRDSSEVLRREYVDLLGHIVRSCRWYTALNDMKCLLFEGDEEADFFVNILHVQHHRRQRTIRRLGMLAAQNKLVDSSIAHYLLPMIEHYVGGDSKDSQENSSTDHNVTTQAIMTVKDLARNLSWNQYRAITKRYVANLTRKPENIKINIRLIESVANALHDADDAGDTDENIEDNNPQSPSEEVKVNSPLSPTGLLAHDRPAPEKFAKFIESEVLDGLQSVFAGSKNKSNGIHEDDNLTDRIPLAVSIVKFIHLLPEGRLEKRLPGFLAGYCQIFRSKSQELRDLIRKTLGRIAKILGSHFLEFILRELKGALRRGTQLHILGYTVHSVLVELGPSLEIGDLDPCVGLICEIIMEDTFGDTGTEKDAEDYNSKMKEVKQHKSYDSGQILASNISLEQFGSLIYPIRDILLYGKLSLRVERKIEELLRRYAMGLYLNPAAGDRQVLTMCYELHKIIENEEDNSAGNGNGNTKRLNFKRSFKGSNKISFDPHFLVTLDSRRLTQDENVIRAASSHSITYPQNLHVLSKFVFDTLRTVLGKNEPLMTVENVAAFIPMLEEGLNGKYEGVQISALRLLAFVIKLPVPDMESRIAVFARKTLDLIKSSPSTNTELCQASLRFLSLITRFKTEFFMKDSALAYILERIQPDLEEPDRQGITFTFIRAVLSRNIMLPEVYDVMDRVAQVMVTNQSKVTREACRGLYLQFLTEYPQGKRRLNKQFSFLISNLEYPAAGGRLSVMEMIFLLLNKVGGDLIQDLTTSFFVALVLVIVNDDSTECRQHAAALLSRIVELAEPEQRQYIETYCISWVKNREQPLMQQGGLQVAGLYFEVVGLSMNPTFLEACRQQIQLNLEASQSESGQDIDWKLVYFSLELLSKLATTDPGKIFSSVYQDIWNLISSALLYPHSWVRLSALRLWSQLYRQVQEKAGCQIEVTSEDFQSAAFKMIRQLGAQKITSELASLVVLNLTDLSKYWESNSILYEPIKKHEEPEEQEQEQDHEELEQSGEQKKLHDDQPAPALNWLVQKVASVLRNERTETMAKKACMQYLASVIEVVEDSRLKDLAYPLIMALYPYYTSENAEQRDAKDLCSEALEKMEKRLGVTDYLRSFNAVRQHIIERRVQRKQKRSIQAVAQPELYSRKKIRKNEKKREKRRHVKDESGFYKPKRSNVRR